MNTRDNSENETHANETTPDALAARVTALALGEISDPAEMEALHARIAASPALRAEFDETLATTRHLHLAFQKELPARQAPDISALISQGPNHEIPAADAAAAPTLASTPEADGGTLPQSRAANVAPLVPHHARPRGGFARHGHSGGIPRDNILRFALASAFGSGIAAAFLLFLFRPADAVFEPIANPDVTLGADSGTPPPSRATLNIAAAIPKAAAPAAISHHSEFRATIERPENASQLAARGSLEMHARNRLAASAARLPVLVPGGGENPFQDTARSPGGAPLNLVPSGNDYAASLQAVLALGQNPQREFVRLDGLANALLAPSSAAQSVASAARTNALASGEIHIEAEAVSAPWNPGHWFVRATVRVGGTDGALVANATRAVATFDPAQARQWRLLGCEDGDAGATTLAAPARLHNGDVLTTLYELAPSANARPETPLGEIKINCVLAADGRNVELSVPIRWPAANGELAAASEETRLAAATTTFGLALRNSPHKGTATLALAKSIPIPAHHPSKPILAALLRDADAL